MFDAVTKFEESIAEFFGAPYAVATDCCTHALELCLRYHNIKHTSCPIHTYLSVPMTFRKLNISWDWQDIKWQEYYHLAGTNIIDAAVLWRPASYIPKTLMCVSFQYSKHLSLGRGGVILLDDQKIQQDLIKLSYDGRIRGVPWAKQQVNSIGYHYYMTPEIASLGLEKLPAAKQIPAKIWNYSDYPNLNEMLDI
jgi:dTDP-4-amino-4,6-dideoxygalactose transaminase